MEPAHESNNLKKTTNKPEWCSVSFACFLPSAHALQIIPLHFTVSSMSLSMSIVLLNFLAFVSTLHAFHCLVCVLSTISWGCSFTLFCIFLVAMVSSFLSHPHTPSFHPYQESLPQNSLLFLFTQIVTNVRDSSH